MAEAVGKRLKAGKFILIKKKVIVNLILLLTFGKSVCPKEVDTSCRVVNNCRRISDNAGYLNIFAGWKLAEVNGKTAVITKTL